MNIYQIIRKFFNLSFHLSFLWKSPKQWESWLRLPKPLERLMPWRLLSAASHFGLDHHLHDNYCQLKNTFCPSQNWRKACGHMGTLGIYSFQARQQCIRCWTSWGRRALSWDNLIITLLPVFFKSFFSEDQASCLVGVDEVQLDMKDKGPWRRGRRS